MPKWLIAVIACVITILIGVNVYLFYSYFSFKAKPVATPTPFIPQAITLSGEIKPGWQLPQDAGYCPKSYYLVTDTGVEEITLSNDFTTLTIFKDPRPYTNFRVDVSGATQKADNNSCGDFIEIANLKVNGINPDDFTVEGIVACVPDSDPDSTCSKSLQIGNVYLGLIGDRFNFDDYAIGDRVKVTGMTQNDFITTTRDFSGAIWVSSIQKI